jgi:hydroxymethylglutaryl-CoA lyase
MKSTSIKLIECPRDAMQGWKSFIPTNEKINYINALLGVGFDTIDFGSFVSAKAIPQMADTADVLKGLDFSNTRSKLLAIVANTRGAGDALKYDAIQYLGFPFSVSPTFQQRNTNSSIEESFERVQQIQELCLAQDRELVVYLSMGFGNPYGDPYSEELVFDWADRLAGIGIKTLSLADTVGLASAEQVYSISKYLIEALPTIEIGVHLHSTPFNRAEKLEAALKAGCYRIDGALKGIGGCPMADDELVGNMDSEWMIQYLQGKQIDLLLNSKALRESISIASRLFL